MDERQVQQEERQQEQQGSWEWGALLGTVANVIAPDEEEPSSAPEQPQPQLQPQPQPQTQPPQTSSWSALSFLTDVVSEVSNDLSAAALEVSDAIGSSGISEVTAGDAVRTLGETVVSAVKVEDHEEEEEEDSTRPEQTPDPAVPRITRPVPQVGLENAPARLRDALEELRGDALFEQLRVMARESADLCESRVQTMDDLTRIETQLVLDNVHKKIVHGLGIESDDEEEVELGASKPTDTNTDTDSDDSDDEFDLDQYSWDADEFLNDVMPAKRASEQPAAAQDAEPMESRVGSELMESVLTSFTERVDGMISDLEARIPKLESKLSSAPADRWVELASSLFERIHANHVKRVSALTAMALRHLLDLGHVFADVALGREQLDEDSVPADWAAFAMSEATVPYDACHFFADAVDRISMAFVNFCDRLLKAAPNGVDQSNVMALAKHRLAMKTEVMAASTLIEECLDPIAFVYQAVALHS